MEWLIFILVCWAAVRFLAPGRCGEGRWASRQLRGARAPKPLPQKQSPPQPEPETEEQRLRRQYVEGSLTVEQYERELDRLYRARS